MTKWCRLTVEVPFDGVFNLAKLVEMNCRVCNFELLPEEDSAFFPEIKVTRMAPADLPNGEAKAEEKPKQKRPWREGSGKNEKVLRELVDKGEPFTGADAKAFFAENGTHPSSASATMSRFLQKGWIKHVKPGHRPMQVIKAD